MRSKYTPVGNRKWRVSTPGGVNRDNGFLRWGVCAEEERKNIPFIPVGENGGEKKGEEDLQKSVFNPVHH